MGAVINVGCDLTCPHCGRPLEWQSKRLTYDGYWLDVAQSVPLSKRVSGDMHALCDDCRLWFEVEITAGKLGPINSSALPESIGFRADE